MSSLYDDASLIAYPSGYKSGVIYSQKATDGSGDLTFTRASTATRVNADGLIESVATGVPRIDYTGGGCGKFKFEPQRTNLVTYSADHTQTNKEACTTIGNVLAPDGSTNAWKVVEDTTLDEHVCITDNPTNFSAGEIGTCSVFVKAAERTSARIWFHHITLNQFAFVDYNLITGEFISSGASNGVFVGSTIVAMNNGWWRVSITGYKNVSTYSWSPAVSPLDDNGDVRYLGDGTSGLYMWGGQTERGANYPTSYIPTAGATATRLQDVMRQTGLGSIINSVEGTIYVQMAALANDSTNRYITLSDGTATNRIIFKFGTGSNEITALSIGTATQFNLVSSSATITDMNKIALKYKANDCALWINGVEVATDSTFTAYPIGVLTVLGFINSTGTGQFLQAKLQEFMLFPTALTDTELATLTTL